MLLKGSCSVRLQPEVWQWVRRAKDLGFLGLKVLTSLAQSMRAARSLATSIKWFMPTPQKKDRRGAKESMSIPALTPARRYSKPSARV